MSALHNFPIKFNATLQVTLSDSELLPLRSQNGLYIQRYAPMFRIAVPYGLLASRQLRKLAEVTVEYAIVATRARVYTPKLPAQLDCIRGHPCSFR